MAEHNCRAEEKVNIEMNSTIANVAVTTTIIPSPTQQVPNITGTIPVPVTITEFKETTIELLTTTANAVTASLMQNTTNEPTPTMISVTYSDSLPISVTNLTSSIGNVTNVVNTTASDIVEIVTLTSKDTATLITTLSSTSTTLSPATITESTQLIQNATIPISVTTNNYSESVLSTLISSVDGNSSELHKDTLTSTEKASCKITLCYIYPELQL